MTSPLSKIKTKYDQLNAHEGFKRYFVNTGWMFSEKILRLISGLFIGAYVARFLGPAQYGLLNYVLSLVSIFSVLAALGLDSIIIRELIKDESRQKQILGTSLWLRMMAAAVLLVVLFAMITLTSTDPTTKTLVFIIGTGIFFEAFGVIDFFFQSRVLSKYAVWSQMISMAAVAILRVILVWQKSPLAWFAITYALDLAVLALGLTYFYVRNVHGFFGLQFDKKIAAELLKDSWPLILSSLSIMVYMRISHIMIQWMLGSEASGNYGVAVRLCEAWNFIPAAICGSVFPAIINAKRIDEALYLRRLQRLFDLMAIISVGIAIPMTFLSGYIVRFLFGNAYGEAGGIVVLYIWSSVFVFLGTANGKWIIGENLQRFRMVSYLIAALMNIVLNYFLIRTVGLQGAAISNLVTYAFAGYFSFLLTKKTRLIFVSMTRSLNPFRLLQLKGILR